MRASILCLGTRQRYVAAIACCSSLSARKSKMGSDSASAYGDDSSARLLSASNATSSSIIPTCCCPKPQMCNRIAHHRKSHLATPAADRRIFSKRNATGCELRRKSRFRWARLAVLQMFAAVSSMPCLTIKLRVRLADYPRLFFGIVIPQRWVRCGRAGSSFVERTAR